MAEASISIDQEHLNCPICLFLLKDPVTTPCGHSFCMVCINVFWDDEHQKRTYSCPQCRETFQPRPVLRKSNVLTGIIESLQKTELQASFDKVLPLKVQDVECDFCTDEKKKAVKSCLTCLASYCDTHVQPHHEVPAFRKHQLVSAIGNLEEKTCPQHKKLLEVFCRTDRRAVCYQCLIDNHKGHNIVTVQEEWMEKKKQFGELQMKYQDRLEKRETILLELKELIESFKRSAQAAVEDSERIFSELHLSIEKRRCEVTELIRAHEKAELDQMTGHLEQLEHEIADLKTREAELEKLSHPDDYIHFVQSFLSPELEFDNSCKIAFNSQWSFENFKTSLFQLKEELEDFCKKKIEKITKNEGSKMAEASILVDPDQLTCSICLELLKDPATIPCGHSFCMMCITRCWDTEDCKCPHCRQIFTPRPTLGKNHILADMVEKLKGSGVQIEPPTDECYPAPGDVACGICVNRKRKAEKSCLVCLDSFCQNHFMKHEELHPEKKHKVVDATEIKERICSEHGKLMEVFCRTDQKCICLSCVTDQHKGHDIISAEAGKNEKKVELKLRFQLQIQERERELNALTKIVEPLKSSAQEAFEESEKIIAELVEQVRLKCSEVTQLIIDQKETECVRALELADQVEEVLDDLKRRDNELEHLLETEDHVQTLQSLLSLAQAKKNPGISVNENLSFRQLKFDLEKLKKSVTDTCESEFQLFSREVQGVFLEAKTRKEMLRYSKKLTLDKCTAFRKHKLSEAYTKVTWSDTPISFGDGWSRFSNCRQVLCNEVLSDQAYWEVDWSGGGGISIAVAYGKMKRKGYVSESGFGYNEDSWALQCYRSNFAFIHDGYETTLPGPISEYVGVYLDYKAGLLAFYSVSKEATLLHKVHTTFTEPLIPGFYVDSWSELKICNR